MNENKPRWIRTSDRLKVLQTKSLSSVAPQFNNLSLFIESLPAQATAGITWIWRWKTEESSSLSILAQELFRWIFESKLEILEYTEIQSCRASEPPATSRPLTLTINLTTTTTFNNILPCSIIILLALIHLIHLDPLNIVPFIYARLTVLTHRRMSIAHLDNKFRRLAFLALTTQMWELTSEEA